MKDSVTELRTDIKIVEMGINTLIDRLMEEYPDFTFSLSLSEHKEIGKRRQVVVVPELK